MARAGNFSLAVASLVLAAGLGARAQTVAPVTSLSFGAFFASSGGSVAVSPAGTRSATGGVVLATIGSTGSAAQFAISGTPNASYAITLPADGSVVLADGSGRTMAVNGFTSSPAASGTLPTGGTQLLAVGATLVVGAAQPRGSYAGTFSLTVNYP